MLSDRMQVFAGAIVVEDHISPFLSRRYVQSAQAQPSRRGSDPATRTCRPLWPFSQAGTAPPKQRAHVEGTFGWEADIQDSQSFGRS
jgi:hypothetical protein